MDARQPTFRVYLRSPAQEVSEKTVTPAREVAELAFRQLVQRTDLDGTDLAVACTFQGRQVAYHEFAASPGDPNYWRDRLEAVPWPHPLPSKAP